VLVLVVAILADRVPQVKGSGGKLLAYSPLLLCDSSSNVDEPENSWTRVFRRAYAKICGRFAARLSLSLSLSLSFTHTRTRTPSLAHYSLSLSQSFCPSECFSLSLILCLSVSLSLSLSHALRGGSGIYEVGAVGSGGEDYAHTVRELCRSTTEIPRRNTRTSRRRAVGLSLFSWCASVWVHTYAGNNTRTQSRAESRRKPPKASHSFPVSLTTKRHETKQCQVKLQRTTSREATYARRRWRPESGESVGF
jgi:hypothetical protein